MNCFACAALGRSTAAAAVCAGCGAAVCSEHGHVAPHWLTYTAVINRTVAVEPPGRTIRCGICREVFDAVPTGQTAARS